MTADDVVSNGLLANDTVKMYRRPGYDQEVIKTFAIGEYIGVVNSYVIRDGLVWWQIGNGLTVNGYIPHITGSLTMTDVKPTDDYVFDPLTNPMNETPLGDIPAKEGSKASILAGILPFTITNKTLIGITVAIGIAILGMTIFIKLKKKK